MDFLYLLRPPKFSAVEVIWKDLLKKKKKTTDTVFTFISEWRGLGLRSTGVPWWHRGHGQKKKSGSTIIFHRWFSIKPWFVQWWDNKASAITLLVHFPGVYIRFEGVHPATYAPSYLAKSSLVRSGREPVALASRPTTESRLCHLLAVRIWAHP